MNIWNTLSGFFHRKEEREYQFTLFTQAGREPVSDYYVVEKKLDELYKEKKGFVRLEFNPPIDGKRYLESIYDAECDIFYICILEDRIEGQGFLEYRCLKPNKKIYKYLLEKHSFGSYIDIYFSKKNTGIQRSVTTKGIKEILYMAPYEVQSPLYDEFGMYGGDQKSLMNYKSSSEEGKKIRSWVRKYHPTYNSEQIEALLKRVNDEGCGYVVVVNILFAHFINKVTEFERKFGFPLNAANGDLNYDMLLLDFYLATDNHYEEGGIDKINYEEDRDEEEKKHHYNYTVDTTGYGTSQQQRNYRMQLYLKDKGIKVKIVNYIEMWPGKFKELSQKGYVMMALNYGNVQKEDGSCYMYCTSHAMIITGVTYDGRYIVSSWGKKYYVDPNEVVEKDGKKTYFNYQYFEFL